MAKIIFISVFIAFIISSPGLSFADGDHSLSPDDVLGKILISQNVDEINKIDCQKVTNEQFEQLGEASMSVIHPNKEEHEFMDQMMGGEGSESLKTIHATMGQNYLGCGNGMMGGGMMGGMDMMSMMKTWSNPPGENSFNNIMGYNMMSGFGVGGWLGWTFMFLIWALVIAAFIALIKWIIKK